MPNCISRQILGITVFACAAFNPPVAFCQDNQTPLGWSEPEWSQIAKKAKALGYANNADQAKKLAPALTTSKSVFLGAGIKTPSANQLFNLIKALTADTCFVQMSPEETNTSLIYTIVVAKMTGTPVATLEQLQKLEHTSRP